MTTINSNVRSADMDWLRSLAIDARSPELVSAIDSLKRKYTSATPSDPVGGGGPDLAARLAVDLAKAFRVKATQLGADVSIENLADFQGYVQGTISDALGRTEALGPRTTVDVYSYCKGLEVAADICDKPARAWGSDFIEQPAALVHARILRAWIQAYARPEEPSAELPVAWRELADYLDRLEGQMKAIDADMMVDEKTPPSVWADRVRKFASTQPDEQSSDEGWQAGCDHVLEQLCKFLGVKRPDGDAGTEIKATIRDILQAKLGECWWPDSEWIHVRPQDKNDLELIREAGYTFRGIELIENTRRSLLDVIGDLYQKNQLLEASARISEIAPILEALRAIRDITTVEFGSSDAFRARMKEIRERADAAIQLKVAPGSMASEALELALEFEGEARAHRAMKDNDESTKCLRAANALRKLAEGSLQAEQTASVMPSEEPAGQQYRYKLDGGWSDWISMPNTMEPLQQDNLQYRFVYAGPTAPADTFKLMLEQVEKARADGTFSSVRVEPIEVPQAPNGDTRPDWTQRSEAASAANGNHDSLVQDLGRLLKILKLAYSKGGGRLMSVWQVDIDALERALQALAAGTAPKLSDNARALIGAWHSSAAQSSGPHEFVGMKIDRSKLTFLDTLPAFEEIVLVAAGRGGVSSFDPPQPDLQQNAGAEFLDQRA
ncbi:hypothetical protein ACVIGB_000578 [Bradyrhizobium sp. USDA 4341]